MNKPPVQIQYGSKKEARLSLTYLLKSHSDKIQIPPHNKNPFTNNNLPLRIKQTRLRWQV